MNTPLLTIGQMVFFQPDATCASGLIDEDVPVTIIKLADGLATLRTPDGRITPQVSTAWLVPWLTENANGEWAPVFDSRPR